MDRMSNTLSSPRPGARRRAREAGPIAALDADAVRAAYKRWARI